MACCLVVPNLTFASNNEILTEEKAFSNETFLYLIYYWLGHWEFLKYMKVHKCCIVYNHNLLSWEFVLKN